MEEEQAAFEAEKAANFKLQHDREQARKRSENVPATLSPAPDEKGVVAVGKERATWRRRLWPIVGRSRNGNNAGVKGTTQSSHGDSPMQHPTPDPATTHEYPSKDPKPSSTTETEVAEEPSHANLTPMPAAKHEIPSRSSNPATAIEKKTAEDLSDINPIPDPMVISKTPCKDSKVPIGTEGRTVQEPGHINQKPIPGTARELPSKTPEPSSEGRTVEEPHNLQPSSQKHPPAGPESSPANATAKVAVEELAIPVANATASANTSTGSSKFTTAPEGRISGTRVAKSGPQEVPKALPDEPKAVSSPPVLLVPNGHVKPSELENHSSREDEILPVQPLERRRGQKLKK
jgi:hypothetical protein